MIRGKLKITACVNTIRDYLHEINYSRKKATRIPELS